jgi:hypothetical protein
MRIWLSAVLVLSVLGASCLATDNGFKTVEGRVYARLDNVRGPVDPVDGAKVSNNWEQTVATTDYSGRFVIRVNAVETTGGSSAPTANVDQMRDWSVGEATETRETL